MRRFLSLLLALCVALPAPLNAQVPGLSSSLLLARSNAYPCANSTGGTITTYGNVRVHTFTSSGTFTPSGGCTINYLVVAGGGAGGSSGVAAAAAQAA